MDLKSNANSPCKKEAEGNYTDRSEGVSVKIKAEINVATSQGMPPATRNQKSQETDCP